MSDYTHYKGTIDDFAAFLGVSPRPATPSEAQGYEGKVSIYEVQIDQDQKLTALHAQVEEGGDEDIIVSLVNNRHTVLYQYLNCVSILVDKTEKGEVFLVLREGTSNLYIHKNPWHLYVVNSMYYQDAEDPCGYGIP